MVLTDLKWVCTLSGLSFLGQRQNLPPFWGYCKTHPSVHVNRATFVCSELHVLSGDVVNVSFAWGIQERMGLPAGCPRQIEQKLAKQVRPYLLHLLALLFVRSLKTHHDVRGQTLKHLKQLSKEV